MGKLDLDKVPAVIGHNVKWMICCGCKDEQAAKAGAARFIKEFEPIEKAFRQFDKAQPDPEKGPADVSS